MDALEGKDKVLAGLAKINEGYNMLLSGGSDYYIRKLTEYTDLLFGRFAPFKRGDRIRLRKDWTTDDKNNGWHCHQHFMLKDAKATVHQVDADKKGFYAYIEFDIETWIPSFGDDKRPQPVSNKHLFDFHESWLEKIE